MFLSASKRRKIRWSAACWLSRKARASMAR